LNGASSLTAAIENRTVPAEKPARKGVLLVVDDEEGPRQSLNLIFKDDYEVVLASDGATAIEMAQKRRIDVAV